MTKILAAIAALAPALMILPAPSASADSVCAPVTIDGQLVCQDLTPVEQAIANAEATALADAATAEGIALGVVDTVLSPLDPEARYSQEQAQCATSVPHDSRNLIAVDAVTVDNEGPTSQWSQYPECSGSEVTVPPVGTVPGPTQHVHVPQVCLTTTDTCVGPVDQDVQLPAEPNPTVCTQPEHIDYTPFSSQHWYRVYEGPISCVSVLQ